MKKSTYILIGFLAAVCLLAFFLPPLVFRTYNVKTISLSENYVSKELPAFSVIQFVNVNFGGDDPLFKINATEDSLKVGRIEINEVFADLKDGFHVSGDTLYIDMNVVRDDKDEDSYRVVGAVYEKTDKPAAILYLAQSVNPYTLMMNPWMDIELEGLESTDFIVYGNGTLNVSESSLHKVEMYGEDGDYKYYGLQLNLKDNSNIERLNVMDNGLVIKTSESRIDTIFASSERNITIELEEADFSTLITDENSSVSVSLKGEATISRQ